MTVSQKNRIGISFKTSIISGIIVLVLLGISSIISINLQSKLSQLMIDRFTQSQSQDLKKYTSTQNQIVRENTKINLEICSSIAESFIYNFDQGRLKGLLANFVKIDSIVAIQIFDADNKEFAAAWNDSGISTGTDIPSTIKLNKQFFFSQDSLHDGEKVGIVKFYYTDKLVRNEIGKKKKQIEQSIIDFSSIAAKSISKAIKIQIFVTMCIIVALIASIVLCLKFIVTNPINNTVKMINNIAQGEGDLTKRLKIISENEIGDLAKGFNLFVKKLQEIITDISGNSENLNSSSSDLLGISNKMSLETQNLSDKSNSVAVAAEEMSTNMSSVAAAAEESLANISVVSAAAEEMTSTINEISKNTANTRITSNQVVEQTKNASEKIDTLSKSAQEIGKVVETINDISEQTNLLALNATIEAARAGDAGKGFAVVASEIKSLAQQTAEATLEIKAKIENIQDSTKETVSEIVEITNAISSVNKMIDTVAAAVEEQSATTKEIASNVNQAALGIEAVTHNVTQSSTVANEIAKDIADVNQSSNEMSNDSAQINTSADELSILSEELKNAVDQFII